MANAPVFLSDLQNGRSSSTVQVRLLRFWEAVVEISWESTCSFLILRIGLKLSKLWYEELLLHLESDDSSQYPRLASELSLLSTLNQAGELTLFSHFAIKIIAEKSRFTCE
ncbi:unnamed protein product [Brassica napus]|uniref:(rape) hypothetical protein n=1 Tax=Brassica napus TaxID=3708 RepID=A0A816Q785_BRANA|nr:unnamed protein product [Brassica napus]